MALKSVMINDIIAEHKARISNLKKYYPFFVLSETSFANYKDGKYAHLDMGYITLATLRFLINENNFHEKYITYEEYEKFAFELLGRDFEIKETSEEMKPLIQYIFDKIKNDGRSFEYRFYDPENHETRIARVKLVESKIEDGKVYYTITPEAIEFYLDTKEIKDESKINVSQLLLKKMIDSNNFRGGIDVVKRINNQVEKLKARKIYVERLLAVDVFEGVKEYESYMDQTAKWFTEEQKLFAKNRKLLDEALTKASKEGAATLKEINILEDELKQTIKSHSNLIAETMELAKVSDDIIQKGKLRRLRDIFDFESAFGDILHADAPSKLSHIMMPFFQPKLMKSFAAYQIDNMLALKAGAEETGEKIEKTVVDFDFKYEDEILDEQIEKNFGRLFYELLDQLDKWKTITLREFSGVLEIKYGPEVFSNRDLYAFFAHLALKDSYILKDTIANPDTILEKMVVNAMSPADIERFDYMEITIKKDATEEVALSENSFITEMIFERNER